MLIRILGFNFGLLVPFGREFGGLLGAIAFGDGVSSGSYSPRLLQSEVERAVEGTYILLAFVTILVLRGRC